MRLAVVNLLESHRVVYKSYHTFRKPRVASGDTLTTSVVTPTFHNVHPQIHMECLIFMVNRPSNMFSRACHMVRARLERLLRMVVLLLNLSNTALMLGLLQVAMELPHINRCKERQFQDSQSLSKFTSLMTWLAP
jgi:hypothetical protein